MPGKRRQRHGQCADFVMTAVPADAAGRQPKGSSCRRSSCSYSGSTSWSLRTRPRCVRAGRSACSWRAGLFSRQRSPAPGTPRTGRRTCRSLTPRVMNTTRLAWSLSGQADKFHRRMDQVLHRLEHHRALAAREIEQPLDAQEIGPAQRDQRLHRALEHRPYPAASSSRMTKLTMPSLCEASATKPECRSMASACPVSIRHLRIDVALDRDVDRRRAD